MSKKQTAVEWLKEKIEDELTGFTVVWGEEFEQALQLEREQIEDAFDEGNPNGFIDKNGEQYYTQTYGKCTPQS